MTKIQKAVGLGVAVLAGLAVAAAVTKHPKPPTPPAHESGNKHEMTFPTHLEGFTPEAPPTCHTVYQKRTDGSLELLMQHDIMDKHGTLVDMRGKTKDEQEAAIREDFDGDAMRLGMACSEVGKDSPFFPSAYAQPHCTDCGGGGCASWSCAGHIVQAWCALGGGSCVITIICCSGDCTPTC